MSLRAITAYNAISPELFTAPRVVLAFSGVVKSCPELSRCSRVFQRFPGQFLKRSGAIHDVIRKRPNASFQSPRCSSGFLKSHSSAVSISRVASCIRRRRSSMAIAASSASGGTCSARVTSEKLGRSTRSKVRGEELIEVFRSGIKRSGTGIGAGSGGTLGLELCFRVKRPGVLYGEGCSRGL